jgi:hypothetical protein
MRRSMIQSMVKVCFANSVPSRGRLDVDDSRNHRVHSGSASMGARGLICCILRCLMNPHESGEPIGNVCVVTNCGFF